MDYCTCSPGNRSIIMLWFWIILKANTLKLKLNGRVTKSHETENVNCIHEQQNRVEKTKALFFVGSMVLQFDRLCLLELKPCLFVGVWLNLSLLGNLRPIETLPNSIKRPLWPLPCFSQSEQFSLHLKPPTGPDHSGRTRCRFTANYSFRQAISGRVRWKSSAESKHH